MLKLNFTCTFSSNVNVALRLTLREERWLGDFEKRKDTGPK